MDERIRIEANMVKGEERFDIDLVKDVAIFLMLYGHCIQYCTGGSNITFSENWIFQIWGIFLQWGSGDTKHHCNLQAVQSIGLRRIPEIDLRIYKGMNQTREMLQLRLRLLPQEITSVLNWYFGVRTKLE